MIGDAGNVKREASLIRAKMIMPTIPYAMRSLFLLCLLLMAACQSKESPPSDPETFRADGTLSFVRADSSIIRTIEIEIAEDDASRQRGLMYRRQMTLDQGMLFIFNEEDMRSFWMANTPIPLDIAFVDADAQIVNIVKRTKPLSQEHVNSTGPAQYVVEVRGGFSDRYGLDETASIRWQRNE